MKWAVGVTTINERRHDLLPRTLRSLTDDAGFAVDRLFVDGDNDPRSWEEDFRLPVTCRSPRVRTAAHWILALHELYIRRHDADRFVMAQDDAVFAKDLRAYLERVPWPESSYLNLYTFPVNHPGELRRRGIKAPPDGHRGFYESNQLGKGAVCLVFDGPGVVTVLQNRDHILERCKNPTRGHKAIDGGVVDAMRKSGYREMVHMPSLCQHTGTSSSMGNRRHPLATSFPGEGWSALEVLHGPQPTHYLMPALGGEEGLTL